MAGTSGAIAREEGDRLGALTMFGFAEKQGGAAGPRAGDEHRPASVAEAMEDMMGAIFLDAYLCLIPVPAHRRTRHGAADEG